MRIPIALRLVAVSPGAGSLDSIVAFARSVCEGGVTAVWLRERGRTPAELLELVRRVRQIADVHGAGLIVSGADEPLLDAGAHALQLGRHEPGPRVVRARLGATAVLGFSAHDPVDTAAIAAVDFIVLAPVFTVPEKGPALGLERFRELVRAAPVPVLGLGGIDEPNVAAVIEAGAAGVAVQRAIAGAANSVAAARALRAVVDRAFG